MQPARAVGVRQLQIHCKLHRSPATTSRGRGSVTTGTVSQWNDNTPSRFVKLVDKHPPTLDAPCHALSVSNAHRAREGAIDQRPSRWFVHEFQGGWLPHGRRSAHDSANQFKGGVQQPNVRAHGRKKREACTGGPSPRAHAPTPPRHGVHPAVGCGQCRRGQVSVLAAGHRRAVGGHAGTFRQKIRRPVRTFLSMRVLRRCGLGCPTCLATQPRYPLSLQRVPDARLSSFEREA